MGRTSGKCFAAWIICFISSTRINISLWSSGFFSSSWFELTDLLFWLPHDGGYSWQTESMDTTRRIEKLLTGTTLRRPCFRFLIDFVFRCCLDLSISITIFLYSSVEWLCTALGIVFMKRSGEKTGLQAFAQMSQRNRVQSLPADQWYARDQKMPPMRRSKSAWSGNLYSEACWCFGYSRFRWSKLKKWVQSVINENFKKHFSITFTSALLVIEGTFTLGIDAFGPNYIIGHVK